MGGRRGVFPAAAVFELGLYAGLREVVVDRSRRGRGFGDNPRGGGVDLVNGGREAGDRWVTEFTANCYHQTCDEWRPDFDLRGAAQDVALYYQLGRKLGWSNRWPQWSAGSEFRAVREESAGQRGR